MTEKVLDRIFNESELIYLIGKHFDSESAEEMINELKEAILQINKKRKRNDMSTTTHTKLVKYGAKLESTVISGADFVIDPTKRTGTINVFFKNGDDYIYEDVPEMIFLGLLHAESHGQYFIKHIKDNYEFAKIN